MNPTDTTPPGEPASVCFFCGRQIPDNTWFARIRRGTARVVFCRPRCVELCFAQPGELNASSGADRLVQTVD